ncbi:MAG: cation:proton antiporter [Pusillimonas sp.]|nr:cation:proton antiporter [Pusillimonas sp.]
MPEIYTEFALILIIAAMAGAIGLKLKQPLIITYIIVGILAGPAAFGFVSAHSQIELLAQIGITVLLFLVGLKLDLKQVRQLGPVALATGLGQLSFTIVIGFALIMLLGKPAVEALYVAVALTFSSTIIIIKLLSDKRELDSLHGRIAVGFLIVQDLAVVVAMMVMSAMGIEHANDSTAFVLGLLALKIITAVLCMYVLVKWVLPQIIGAMARSQELLLVFAMALGTGLAAVGEWAGFSKEAGAFLAGFALASSGYRDAINARLSGIKDFLLLFFFIHLGSQLDFSTLGDELFSSAVLSAFVLIGNPLIIMAIMGYMGYRKRTGFMAGLTVAQISEFSIIFIAMGISMGHIGQNALGLTTLVGLITIALSTYMILYSQKLYSVLSPLLGLFERRNPYRELAVEQDTYGPVRPDVIVFGLGRYGTRLAHGLKHAGLKVAGVDFDPQTAKANRRHGIPVHYGDGADEEFIGSLPLHPETWIISTLPELEANTNLLRILHKHYPQERIAIVARDEHDRHILEQLGATKVFFPINDAVDYTIESMTEILQPAAPTKQTS